MRVVVLGASSGLGRCVAIGLGSAGHDVALLARRKDRLDRTVEEMGGAATAIECDVTDEVGCHEAVAEAARQLGGIDALVYATGVGTLGHLADMDAATWTRTLATNVVGAAIATQAALPHLQASDGRAIYFSSVSASMTPAWPGLGAYISSKAALDKMVEAWRIEHPEVGFTRLIVGDCGGGDGDSAIGFTEGWDMDLAVEVGRTWYEKGYIAGALLDVQDLVDAVDGVIRLGSSAVVPTMAVLPRVPRAQG
ncbi:SDR family oxidoreductase [Dermatobacter hominis]|uniref:SDR family oxidoreductase n=1 Tax=Dermatobacter hominis TaxID=2884263 RepID=UPI001D11D065|nr:SDR family oxidoreductase [Dermatobacter hominis]UDY36636.1 SDR family oxidoreductase [Dermatobacter hominis]